MYRNAIATASTNEIPAVAQNRLTGLDGYWFCGPEDPVGHSIRDVTYGVGFECGGF
jgi:hypothetical protein